MCGCYPLGSVSSGCVRASNRRRFRASRIAHRRSVTPLTSSPGTIERDVPYLPFPVRRPTRLEVLADTFEHAQIVRLVDEVPERGKEIDDQVEGRGTTEAP